MTKRVSEEGEGKRSEARRSTLNPLSTFIRGARVAVMKYREQGDHPYVTEQWALLEPIFLHKKENKKEENKEGEEEVSNASREEE